MSVSVKFQSIHFDYLPSRIEGRPAIYVETRRDDQPVKIGQLVKLVLDKAPSNQNKMVPLPNPYSNPEGLEFLEVDEMMIEDIDGVRIVLVNGPTSTGCKDCKCGPGCPCGLSCSCRQKANDRWGYQVYGQLVTVSKPIIKTAFEMRKEKYGFSAPCGFGSNPNLNLPWPSPDNQ